MSSLSINAQIYVRPFTRDRTALAAHHHHIPPPIQKGLSKEENLRNLHVWTNTLLKKRIGPLFQGTPLSPPENRLSGHITAINYEINRLKIENTDDPEIIALAYDAMNLLRSSIKATTQKYTHVIRNALKNNTPQSELKIFFFLLQDSIDLTKIGA